MGSLALFRITITMRRLHIICIGMEFGRRYGGFRIGARTK